MLPDVTNEIVIADAPAPAIEPVATSHRELVIEEDIGGGLPVFTGGKIVLLTVGVAAAAGLIGWLWRKHIEEKARAGANGVHDDEPSGFELIGN